MLNAVQIMGTLGADPEIRYTPTGVIIAQANIACNKYVGEGKGDNGSKYATDWFTVKAFNKTGETLNEYFRKGSRIIIVGKLSQEKWVNQEGQKQSKVVIIADRVEFVDKKGEGGSSGGSYSSKSGGGPVDADEPMPGGEYGEEEIPF